MREGIFFSERSEKSDFELRDANLVMLLSKSYNHNEF
jgi:hypothetical protein